MMNSYKVTRVYGAISKDDYGHYSGHVLTPYGYVLVWQSNVDQKAKSFTSLRFVLNGREYCKSYRGRKFTVRGLSIVAAKFAREVFNGGTQ